MMRRLLFVLAGLCCAGGCIDTEEGFAADLQSAAVRVEGDAGGDVVALELRVHVRVGTHALDGRNFRLTRARVSVGGRAVAEAVLDRPEDLDDTLEPGESRTFTVRGASPPGAFPDARAALCGGGVTAEVLVQWEATLTTGDPANPTTMELGSFDDTITDVTCP